MSKDESSFSHTFRTVQKEVNQAAELRHPYLREISKARDGRAVVSFFISFRGSYPMMQEDADQLEEVLCNSDCSKGLTLLLDAPGGDGLAAERVIQVCRSYSQGDFETIVAARAKSAATMVCLGSDRILMSPTSELGPIDPQVPMDLIGEGGGEWVAAHHITSTYDDLFEGAKNLQEGHIEPFLQQLQKFNAVKVAQLKDATRLAEDIAVSSLKRGMLASKDEAEIKELIQRFTDPTLTMSHGRGITCEHARECGLNVEEIDPRSEFWRIVWGLYIRSKYLVDTTPADKLIDTVEASYWA